MMKFNKFLFKTIRKVISITPFKYKHPEIKYINNAEDASKIILKYLSSGNPCMIARLGSTELGCVENYIAVSERSLWKSLTQEYVAPWWEKKTMETMCTNSGFFPNTVENLSKFSELMLQDVKYADVIGSWLEGENIIQNYTHSNFIKVKLQYLEPWWSETPWSKYLSGKRVLVIHPFASTIVSQYNNNRTKLFTNPDILPEFKLEVIQAVQSLGGSNQFNSWFEALDWMKSEMDKRIYDVALIGCGAYGFCLAAHAKRTGHQAIHLGGALQLMFGIKGKRWEQMESFKNLFNEYWCYPSDSEKPVIAEKIENGCYWG